MSNSSPGWYENRNESSESSMRSKNYHVSGKVGHGASSVVQTSFSDLPNRHRLPASWEDLVDQIKTVVSAIDVQPEVVYFDNVSLAHYIRLCEDLGFNDRDKLSEFALSFSNKSNYSFLQVPTSLLLLSNTAVVYRDEAS